MRVLVSGVCLMCLAVLAGCDSEGYEAKLTSAIDSYATQKKFVVLYPQETEIKGANDAVGCNVFIRVPREFKIKLEEGSLDPKSPKGKEIPINLGRLLPPFESKLKGKDGKVFDIPGFKFTYEKWEEWVKGAEMPYSLYVAAVASNTKGAANEDLFQRLTLTFGPLPAWEAVECKSPSGKQISWKRLKIDAKQTFESISGNDDRNGIRPMEGTFELWVCAPQNQGFKAILGWRYPKDLADKVGELPTLVASTVVFK